MAYAPSTLVGRVFRGTEAIERGWLTVHQLRTTSLWRRVRHDVYADASLPVDHELACRAAVLRVSCSQVLVGGPSAAYLAGARGIASFEDPVHLLVPNTVRVGVQKGLVVHVLTSLPSRDPNSLPGIPRTTPARAVRESAVWLPLPQALAVADAVLHHKLATPGEVGRVFRSASSVTARLVRQMADGRVRHPNISVARAVVQMESLPEPVLRYTMATSPVSSLTVDLAWPRYRIAVVLGDQRRAAVLVRIGWIPIVVHPGAPVDGEAFTAAMFRALAARAREAARGSSYGRDAGTRRQHLGGQVRARRSAGTGPRQPAGGLGPVEAVAAAPPGVHSAASRVP